MRISAVLLARAIALFDTSEVNPRGAVRVSSIVPLLVKRFAFEKFPTTLPIEGEAEDAKGKEKGLSFDNGYFEGQTISNLTIYNDGIKIDLLSSTDDGKKILLDSLHWLVEEIGITFSEKMLRRWGFLSNVVFESGLDLDTIHPALTSLGEGVSKLVNTRVGMDLKYVPIGLVLNFDRTNLEVSLANFTIERRGKVPFSANRYYSSAPLETHDHIRLLEEFENNVRSYR